MAIGPGYPRLQLAKALRAAEGPENGRTRRQAADRVHQWELVLDGIASGELEVGSRTPVAETPAWLSLEVVRGGFATGRLAAGGDLLPYEWDLAGEAGLPAERGALFAWYLTDAGLERLGAMLDSGRYAVHLPEESALLVVAWLVRAGDRAAALELLAALQPWADRVRFAPRPVTRAVTDWSVVSRQTVAEVRVDLGRRQADSPVAVMNEALTVWNPFADDLLTHWLGTVRDGRVGVTYPEGWSEGGRALLERYERLAADHTLCGKHRRPKENLAVLRTALSATLDAGALPEARRGLLQHAVDSMVRRRGRPGSEQHRALRENQAQDAALPSFHTLAQVVLRRMDGEEPDAGIEGLTAVLAPVDPSEGDDLGVPPGTPVPEPIARVVRRCLAAPVEELMMAGVVPSAEVLAALLPQITAVTTAARYRDEALRTLMAATYRAFRNRRSLLLLDLQHQVRVGELPWFQAVAPYREGGTTARDTSREVLTRTAELALQGFPGTILPNPLVSELDVLAREAGLDVPFTEELAADIFMSAFSPKFTRAAKVAARLLSGSLYERYYDIDFPSVLALSEAARPSDLSRLLVLRKPAPPDLARLCVLRAERAEPPGTGSAGEWVADNGRVIEQCQILTTHNLAALVAQVGVRPEAGWKALALGAFGAVCRTLDLPGEDHARLTAVKDAAYAWRQMVFFLARLRAGDLQEVLGEARGRAGRLRDPARTPVHRLLTGLELVADGGRLDLAAAAGGDGPFLGWRSGTHWILEGPSADGATGQKGMPV